MKRSLFASLCAILLSTGLTVALWAGPVQATVFFDSSFEGANPEADGWGYTASVCNSSPCPYLDNSRDIAHAGSQSLKGVYPPEALLNVDGATNQGITHAIPPSTEVWVRYYYYTVGFQYGPTTGTKHIYFDASLPYLFSINWFGDRGMGFGAQAWVDGGAGNNGQGNLYPNMASVPLNDNRWYCIEDHFKLNDPGQANGMTEKWVDRVQTVAYVNRTIVSHVDPITEIKIYKQTGSGLMYYDQVAVGNTRIGCSGSPDITPPASPSGLSIR